MAGRSRMNREVHVRFCGGLEVKFLRSTRLQTSRAGLGVHLLLFQSRLLESFNISISIGLVFIWELFGKIFGEPVNLLPEPELP